MYQDIKEEAPTWATDTANVIKALTPAAGEIRKIVGRPKGAAPARTAPTDAPAPASKGISTNTLLIGAAAAIALYFILKKK